MNRFNRLPRAILQPSSQPEIRKCFSPSSHSSHLRLTTAWPLRIWKTLSFLESPSGRQSLSPHESATEEPEAMQPSQVLRFGEGLLANMGLMSL